MKQTRRKELKTNELSIFLSDLYQSIERHSNVIIAAALAVLLVLAVIMYVRHNRSAALEAAWNSYYELREKNPLAEPDVLDRIRSLAAEQFANPELGALALELKGDTAYQLAVTLPDPKDQPRRVEFFQEAAATYQEMVDRYRDRPDLVNRARMCLAETQESLAALNLGSRERVRQLYQEVIAAAPNPFVGLAEQNLKRLDERLQPLQIVATRPAEASATRPAVAQATPPAAAPGTQPAAATAMQPAAVSPRPPRPAPMVATAPVQLPLPTRAPIKLIPVPTTATAPAE